MFRFLLSFDSTSQNYNEITQPCSAICVNFDEPIANFQKIYSNDQKHICKHFSQFFPDKNNLAVLIL